MGNNCVRQITPRPERLVRTLALNLNKPIDICIGGRTVQGAQVRQYYRFPYAKVNLRVYA